MTALLDNFPFDLIQDHLQWMMYMANTDASLLELNDLLIDHAYHLVEGAQLTDLERTALESIEACGEPMRNATYYTIAAATRALHTPEETLFSDDDEDAEEVETIGDEELALIARWENQVDPEVTFDGRQAVDARYVCRIQGILMGTTVVREAGRSREPSAPLRMALSRAGLIGAHTHVIAAPRLVEFSQALSWFEARPFSFTRVAQRALAAAPSGRFARHDIWHGLPQAPAGTDEDEASLILLFALVDKLPEDSAARAPTSANTRLITTWPSLMNAYTESSPTLGGPLRWASLPMSPADLLYSQNGIV